ncbi:transposase [Streptomyces sp. NPDC093084]|uniref:transposase n=1 Tax=Streptomyces sp. NPDC093084 TaxID=3155197 RepID=UPI00342F973B
MCGVGRGNLTARGRRVDRGRTTTGAGTARCAALIRYCRTSWCQLLDAVRLGPEDDVAEITARQVRRVVEDLIAGGRRREGDRDILIVFDAGYDAPPPHGLPSRRAAGRGPGTDAIGPCHATADTHTAGVRPGVSPRRSPTVRRRRHRARGPVGRPKRSPVGQFLGG